METVWIYFDMHHSVGHPDYIRVFATREAADRWLAEIDPRGTILEYDVLGQCQARRLSAGIVDRSAQAFLTPIVRSGCRRIRGMPGWAIAITGHGGVSVMKKITLSISLLFLLDSFAWFISPASAAKKTLQECEALAQQRGFNGGNAKMSGKPKGFIRACMSGKQQ